MDEQEPIIVICANCASPSVTRESWAIWDVETQTWVLSELFAYAFCHRCHRRAALVEQPVETRRQAGM